MKLSDFIKLSEEEAVKFDFKNESPSVEVQKESHPVKKFFLYKKDFLEQSKGFDCDRCDLILEIYSNLYPNKYLEYLDSDTMNSFYTTYRLLLRTFDEFFWNNDIITFSKNRRINFIRADNNRKYLLRYKWILSEKVFNHYAAINNHP